MSLLPSPLPYALARPFLFGLDPETAHDLTLRSLARAQGTPLEWVWRNRRVSDPIELAGLAFPNRVGLAAGLDKNARCIDGLGALGFGFIEIGTVTPLPQPGNAKPRMFRLPRAGALINRLGFNNDGLAAFIANIEASSFQALRRRAGRPALLLGLNIGKNAATPIEHALDDYLACLEGVYPYADYVAVNISSPNTKDLRTLQDEKALDALLRGIGRRRDELARMDAGSGSPPSGDPARRVPIFVKIAPDLDAGQVASIASALTRNGMDGVIATNTTLSRDGVLGQAQAQEAGGLSGKPLLAASNLVVSRLRAALGENFPIIGVGGIFSAADALGKIEAGADVVQMYTGLIYRGPALVHQVALGLQRSRIDLQQQVDQ